MDKKKILTGLFLFATAAAAVWLRLLYIDTSLWYDEACSWFTAGKSFPLGIMDNLLHLDFQHTPLYFFLLHFWMKTFGEGEISLRILSVIFGIAAVPIAFVISKKIVPAVSALIITAVTAVSPLLVFFSVEVRMYPLAVFLVLVSLNYLIDFEQKNDIKSLTKLVIINILIPYTFVGGVFYNISLAICYGLYLFKNKKKQFCLYIKGLITEVVLLIPYIILIGYYAKMRSIFIVRHEGAMAFAQIVEAVRNFFGITLVTNLYWPAVDSYTIDFVFTVLVIVPCVYFIYGIIQGYRNSAGFVKTLYSIFILSFVLAVVVSLFEVNVFTVRYILYLLPPMFILGILGLSKKISLMHLKIFAAFFVICSVVSDINYAPYSKKLKMLVMKSVQLEAKELQLGADDIIILPFGADAPYYFRSSATPRVFNFDFHKQARNPYNNNLYDKSQQEKLAGNAKYAVIFDAVFQDKVFSENFFNYFISNVNNTVAPGRYVLAAFFGTDANSIVTLKELRDSVKSVVDVKERTVDILLKKFIYDIRAMLDYDFVLVKFYSKDNYSYMLFQKK